jgi:hypothetical protein
MLTDEGLRRTDRVDEFVNAVGVIGQQVDDREADGGGQRTEQISRCAVPLELRVRDREWCLVQVLFHRTLPCTHAP